MSIQHARGKGSDKNISSAVISKFSQNSIFCFILIFSLSACLLESNCIKLYVWYEFCLISDTHSYTYSLAEHQLNTAIK